MRMSILNRAERFDIHTSSACPTQQTLSIYYLHHGENSEVPNMQKDLSLKSPLLSLCAFSRYSTMPNKKDKQDIFHCPTFSEVGRKIGSVLSSSRQSSLQEHSPLLVPLDIGQEITCSVQALPTHTAQACRSGDLSQEKPHEGKILPPTRSGENWYAKKP